MVDRNTLLQFFDYDRQNGRFFWKSHWNPNVLSRFKGKEAGTFRQGQYRAICIKGKFYYVHRLVWLIETGNIADDIDHINGIRSDNRFCNLRSVDRRRNCQNFRRHRDGKKVGASFCKLKKKWKSEIFADGKRFHLGWFPTEQEAHAIYQGALVVLGKTNG